MSLLDRMAVRKSTIIERLYELERAALQAGMVCLLVTLSTPARFHPSSPHFDGATPADAQGWLLRVWASARATLRAQGIGFAGLRVAEPQHDGNAHWHLLLWVDPATAVELTQAIRDAVREHCSDDRCAVVLPLLPGRVVGSVSRYFDAAEAGDRWFVLGVWAVTWRIRLATFLSNRNPLAA
ncbi:Bacteriophage replication gene A protein (GPA) [Andreprevotia lacus DSM 23236]|jgi:hypothetical protein|uniref:Bacteriophage replication gene A protein (GPA) n=1 Tax=Andreprevotia lacus DSM 23236 TaxID=1121001 RepID=A0A1W1XKB1_9NEIS|nr:replication endonuclease [Andreprevotia lacus]SMC24272.1 Bacteriophage replication gene A protein (GPA) [Andreprevotia lacus DSM 23236]